MVTIMLQTRGDWNARPPTSIVRLDWSKVTKFIVHYSGATRSQSVRSIQDYCMDNKGHSDIDYNELVRGNLLYVGRGNNVGSHTLNNNSTSYGVCMIGLNGDATNNDMNVIRSRYDYACAMAGRKLAMLGHNQAPTLPPGYTSCPGSELQAWINAGMPYLDENAPDVGEDMYPVMIFGQRSQLTAKVRFDLSKMIPGYGVTDLFDQPLLDTLTSMGVCKRGALFEGQEMSDFEWAVSKFITENVVPAPVPDPGTHVHPHTHDFTATGQSGPAEPA